MNTNYAKQLVFRFLSMSAVLLLALLPLGRVLAKESATYEVNTTNDRHDGDCNKGHCSLREAINNANAHPGADMITFNLRGRAPFTIQPLSALPEITDPVTIDGSSQPGFHDNPIVELDGTHAGGKISGLVISAGDSTVSSLVINRFSGDGIFLMTNGGNAIQGNFIGTDASGMVARPNRGAGVQIQSGASHTLIGGKEDGTRNVISGNGFVGIWISGGTIGNIVQGNYIGTDRDGTGALGNNSFGIVILKGAMGNLIGGTEYGARNVISGNKWNVAIGEPGTSGNKLQGNYIGTDRTGSVVLPNTEIGVEIIEGATGNLIGGTEPGAGNVISGSARWGVIIGNINVSGTSGNVVQGNFIGTDAGGTQPLGNLGGGVYIADNAADNLIGGMEPGAGNTIAFNGGAGIGLGPYEGGPTAGSGNALLANSVYSNGRLGIDLGADGVTPNDPRDQDTGPNDSQNYPVITGVTRKGTSVMIHGTLASTPNTTFRLEFFSNTTRDPSGYGEGQAFLGFVYVTTNPAGAASFEVPVPLPRGAFVTTTATNPGGSTSEFSNCFYPRSVDHMRR